jgi:hypothetical protein
MFAAIGEVVAAPHDVGDPASGNIGSARRASELVEGFDRLHGQPPEVRE